MNARALINFSAVVESLTGLSLLLLPALVIRLMLGSDLDQAGYAVARIFGVALISLSVAAWETPEIVIRKNTRIGICLFNIGAAVLLATVALYAGLSGPLLWPIAAFHGLIGAAMIRGIVKQ